MEGYLLYNETTWITGLGFGLVQSDSSWYYETLLLDNIYTSIFELNYEGLGLPIKGYVQFVNLLSLIDNGAFNCSDSTESSYCFSQQSCSSISILRDYSF